MAETRLTIDSIAAGGDGVGRADGMVVFVPRSAPGDLVIVRLAGKKRFARGAITRIETASVARVEPPCQHYTVDRCGGCQLQHIDYQAQLQAKSGIIRDALARIGKREVAAPSVEPSPAIWRYRAKLTLAMRNLPRGWVIGLHPYDDPVGVFQLRDCPITEERVVAVWRAIFANVRLLPPAADRGAVRLGGESGITVIIEGDDTWPDATRFFEETADVTELWWKPRNQPRQLVGNRGTSATGASFAQVNRALADGLRDHVLKCVRQHRPTTVVDGYAGTGATAIPLAEDGISVTAIEVDRHAAAVSARRLPAGSRSLAGRVEELLPAALPTDVLLLNPPRTGLDDAIPGQILASTPRPRAIVYVSCNPATLGRDISRLPDYRIASIRGFDMFPQTAHVETVCELVPGAA